MDFATKILLDAWGLVGEVTSRRQTRHGNRVTEVKIKEGPEEGCSFILKKPVSAHISAAVDRACTFSTLAADELAKVSGAGSVSTLAFRPKLGTAASDRFKYVHDTDKTTKTDKPIRFVLSQMIPETINLHQAQVRRVISPEGVRLHMARALAVLHSFRHLGREELSSECPAHEWHGTISSRLRSLESLKVKSFEGISTEDINLKIDFLEGMKKDTTWQKVSELPGLPVTNDLQSKNFIINPKNGQLTIVNTEILWNTTRLWDLIYLLLIDDECSGVFRSNRDSHDIQSSCLRNFARAIGVYVAHTKSRDGESVLSSNEVAMFPQLLQVKLAQVAQNENVPPEEADRNYALLFMIHRFEGVLQDILANAANAYRHDIPLLCDKGFVVEKQIPLVSCLERIAQGDKSKPTKVLIFLNGTYAPYHCGHLEAVLRAAHVMNEEEGHEVVGVAIAPSKQCRVIEKLGPDVSKKYSSVARVAMIDLALHCRTGGDVDFGAGATRMSEGIGAYVDTDECWHYEPRDHGRYRSIVKRFQDTVAHANTTNGTNLTPKVCFAAGDDVKRYLLEEVLPEWEHSEAVVEGIVVSRTGAPLEEAKGQISSSISVHGVSQSLRVSSSTIRSLDGQQPLGTFEGQQPTNSTHDLDVALHQQVGVATICFWLRWTRQDVDAQ